MADGEWTALLSPPDPHRAGSPPTSGALRLLVLSGLAQIAAARWDALLDVDDRPLLSHAHLSSLEETGCATPERGWLPRHLVLLRGDDVVAAAPAYLKSDSDGEWVYDGAFAEWAEKLGVTYFPKLVLAIPFNPVGGRRVLTHPGLAAEDRHALALALLGAARQALRGRVSSLHALFPRREELPLLEAAGFVIRRQPQYHFLNRGYGGFADFLGDLRHNRRRSIGKERAALGRAGVRVTTHAGLRGPENVDGFTLADVAAVHGFYRGTSERYTGVPPYLTEAHFLRCAQALGRHVELVLARGPDGELQAGAFNLRGDTRLYGRYWGEGVHVPFLHFEVCFYHAIERCIAAGLRAFEPGHGGEQKLLRGFAPVHTYSAHLGLHPALHSLMRRYGELEAPLVANAVRDEQGRCPLKLLPDPDDPGNPARLVAREGAALKGDDRDNPDNKDDKDEPEHSV